MSTEQAQRTGSTVLKRCGEPTAFATLLGPWTPTADGIVPVARWRPDGPPERVPDAFWGGLAGKR